MEYDNLTAATGIPVEEELAAVERAFAEAGDAPSAVRRRIAGYREVLDRSREAVAVLHREGASGVAVCALLTDMTDRFVSHAVHRVFASSHDSGPAVLALGGYGRRELHPHGDVDLLFVIEDAAEGRYDDAVAAVLQYLWDIGFDLGHSTRTVTGCMDWAVADHTFATSLLEGRFVLGNDTIRRELDTAFLGWLRGEEGQSLSALKLEERAKRRALFGGSAQVQEPNVKESPGGLRDVQFIRWLFRIAEVRGETAPLLKVTGAPGPALVRGEHDFLLRLRNALHFLTGRRTDLLDHIILPEAAASLGYPGTGNEPVERLMRDYYRHAGRIFRVAERVHARMAEPAEPTVYSRSRDGILVGSRDLRFDAGASALLAAKPRRLLNLFALAGAQDLRIAGESAMMVEAIVEGLPPVIADDPAVQAAFRDICNLPRGTARTFRLLREYGLMERLIPEFAGIDWHYQYDFYHAYTTDEHSLRVVEHLESFAGQVPPDPALGAVMAEVPARAALYLAGLLHDIGKVQGSDHPRRGAALAARALRRLGLDERTVELVQFLTRDHLLFSHVSQRRDIEDPETVADFAARIGSAGRLRMLLLLTFADLMALSPTALTDWKRSLLWDLYQRGLHHIEYGYERHTTRSRTQAIETAIAAFPSTARPDIRAHLEKLPEQYVRVTRPETVARHLRGIAAMQRHGAWASFRRRGAISHLTVITPDYHHALADICGAITASDINILGARIFTRSDGIVIDTFLVTDPAGGAVSDTAVQRSFKRNLGLVVRHEDTAAALIRSHSRRWRRRKKNVVYAPPRVSIRNDISRRHTVIDIFATDYTGLLYDITSVLADLGLDIHAARIGTDQDQVVDAFYVQLNGEKITDPARLEEIERALIGALERAEGPHGGGDRISPAS